MKNPVTNWASSTCCWARRNRSFLAILLFIASRSCMLFLSKSAALIWASSTRLRDKYTLSVECLICPSTSSLFCTRNSFRSVNLRCLSKTATSVGMIRLNADWTRKGCYQSGNVIQMQNIQTSAWP